MAQFEFKLKIRHVHINQHGHNGYKNSCGLNDTWVHRRQEENFTKNN